ncbi:MAG TPA: RagB/SusD family nutrient uptake outer membrane protein [Lunatimonas sp.]|nr:RagB/SusD family nutrient uptake outer membrane protein [Lunatimonas sp.]
MKKISYKLYTGIIGLILLVSCEDTLMEEPRALMVESFYNSPAEVEAGLAAIYAPIRGQMSGWWIGALDCQAEWGAGLNGAANFDAHKTMQGLDNVASNNIVGIWDNMFRSILYANLVIKYTPLGTVLSDSQKNVYLAEARFMRAFVYFQLVKAWGGVPLYTEETMDQTIGVPKGTKEQVYERIRQDLEFAENYLPDAPPLLGKPSKWSVKTVLADVYFYMGLHAEATSKAHEVIESGKFLLEEVTEADDFNNLFGREASSQEEIFYLKFNQNSTSGLILFTQQINTPWWGAQGYGIHTWHTSSRFYSEWSDSDLRKSFGWYVETSRTNPFLAGQPAFPSSGVTLISPKKYNDPDAIISTFDLPVYRYADLLLIYAEASARANGSPTLDGMEKLNMVHRRAYGQPAQLPSVVDFNLSDYNLESFIDLVIRERGYEFQFEGKRWFDLVRAGKANEVMVNAIGREVAEKHLLWPIPAIEFDLNESLLPSDQNPGY